MTSLFHDPDADSSALLEAGCWHEFVTGREDLNDFMAEDDPDFEPFSYIGWLQSTIDNHEQIWREEPKERDMTEAYLVLLREELAKFEAEG